MLLYADEDFPFSAIEELRRLGHDILTAQADSRREVPDPEILVRAHELGRAVLTHNRWHFKPLHHQGLPHSGIVAATQDPDYPLELAQRVDAALVGRVPGRWFISVYRPQSS